jgi:PITH domain
MGHRPKTLRLFTNRQNAIGFDEAESVEPTQELELTETSYDAEGTAIINLRFVKFQRVNTLTVLFRSKAIPDNRFLLWIILGVRKLLVLKI